MKKFVSALLSVAMIFPLTTCGFAAADPPSGVVISADESFTAAQETTSAATVSGLYSLVTASKRTSLKASEVTELARLVFKAAGNSGKDPEYVIYKAPDGSLCTMKGQRLYSIDADAFYRLVDESGIGFYKYRELPRAKLGVSGLAVTGSGYCFKKLDGLFYKTQFEKSGAVSGGDNGETIKIPMFSIEPESVKVSVLSQNENKTVWSGSLSDTKSFKAEKAGAYTVRYAAYFKSPHYRGEVVYEYGFTAKGKGIDFKAEALSSSGNSAITAPGEVVVLRAFNIPENERVAFKSSINYTPAFFKRANGEMAALLPVSYFTASGSHYVELSCGGVAKRFTLDTRTKKFVEQYLTVPPSTADATINSKKANDEFEAAIAPIRYVSDDKQYWSGRFIWPLKQTYRRTTEFGTIRYTNGDTKNPSRHGAIDFAAPAGTPVYAPAAGRVLYSGNLQLTGNTICIEHGFGLKTWYYHLNGRNVKTGDMVKQGQQIGIVGSTGFSTGAHLHYGMSVSNTVSGNVFVNPETAVNTDLFSFKD